MPRPRMTEEEFDLWDKIKDNQFIADQISELEKQCVKSGIDIKDVKHYWYKGKHFSIFAKNKVKTYDEVSEDVIERMRSHAPHYPHVERKRLADPHLLVIDPSDIHMGKLSVAVETGHEYNIKEAIKRVRTGIESIIQKASGVNVDKILFIIGNDALHIDHPHRKTTAGTPQDTDGMWHESFMAAKQMYVDGIETCLSVADTDVIYCPSNHDFQQGFFLADTLNSWFRNSDQVQFNVTPSHRKYYQYHDNMIEADHGDGCKEKDTPGLMAHEEAQMWANTKFRYSYKHHVHHNRSLDMIGVNVTALRSPSPADGWHDRNGYLNMPAIEGFVHGQNTGRIAHLTHYFE